MMMDPYSANAQIPEPQNLTSTIELTRTEFRRTDSLNIRFTITNNSARTLNLLKWNTPFDGFNDDYFNITRDGEPVLYLGRVVKRGKPQAADYIAVSANSSVSVEINLAEGYGIFQTGEYSVEYNAVILDIGSASPATLSTRKKLEPKAVRSNEATFRILEERPKRAIDPKGTGEGAGLKGASFNDCTSGEKNTLNKALDNAELYAAGARLALGLTTESARPNAKRYTTWFGKYTASRYTAVTQNFQSIYDALSTKTITFHCDCDENYYAYVYPNKPYHIYICNLFWSAPAQGTDSQAGTIIHEVSHFKVVAGTKDHAYGHTNCKNLANNDPAKAIQNADSHEYFAENDPSLPMGLELTVFSILLVLMITGTYIFFNLRRKGALQAKTSQ